MNYPEEYKFDKKDYMVLDKPLTPCGQAIKDYADKHHIKLNELSPSAKANLQRIICGEKVR